MSGLLDAFLIVVVVVVVIARQFRAQRVDTGRRWWLLPVVLAVVALREPGLVDDRHPTMAITLLAAELLIGIAMGAAWAWTSRTWVESDGSVWSKSTKASGAVWLTGIALRAGLYGLGAVFGVNQGSSALLLALAATLLLRAGILTWRAQALRPAPGPDAAYGAGMPLSARKEHV
ncbi:DUF1453 domain-containing protein [Streptomyces sp. NPDC090106]|uniref:DUF1453 domain-containing protein n=1 Tax=Streptomyces sp. NPDC090106 TaxID=3365946 RepID=UPI003802963A